MSAESKTKKVIRNRHGAVGLVFATIEEREFVHARNIVEGFDRWDSFDDFVSERDGQFIGLACAGQIVSQVEVSIRAFETWSSHSRVALSVATLDAFAAQIGAFRARPERLEAAAVPGEESGKPNNSRSDALGFAAAPDLYGRWLKTLASLDIFSEIPSIDVYARLQMEGWADPY